MRDRDWKFREEVLTVVFFSGLGVAPEKGQMGRELEMRERI